MAAYDRWLSNSACRFCGSKVGPVLLHPNQDVDKAFHLECLLDSWNRNETRIRGFLAIAEELRRAYAEIKQLRAALQQPRPTRLNRLIEQPDPPLRVARPAEQQQQLVGRANVAFNGIAARLDLKLTAAQQAMVDRVQNTVLSSPRSLTEQQVTAVESLLKPPATKKEEPQADRFSLIELE